MNKIIPVTKGPEILNIQGLPSDKFDFLFAIPMMTIMEIIVTISISYFLIPNVIMIISGNRLSNILVYLSVLIIISVSLYWIAKTYQKYIYKKESKNYSLLYYPINMGFGLLMIIGSGFLGIQNWNSNMNIITLITENYYESAYIAFALGVALCGLFILFDLMYVEIPNFNYTEIKKNTFKTYMWKLNLKMESGK